MIKLVEQPLYGYPYGFAYVMEDSARRSLRLDFVLYSEMLRWCVQRFGPMDPPGWRNIECERNWTGSDRQGFAFTRESHAVEFKLRWYV